MRCFKKVKLTSAVILLLALTSLGAVPQMMNYQGLLRNGSGVPVPDASYSVVFTIYDAATAGTNLWTETQSVTTSSGLFTVQLGIGPIPLVDSIFNDTTRYLGVKVGLDLEMTPRDRLETVPYAYRSSTVDGASGGRITGNVGIGTTATTAKLTIDNSAGDGIYSNSSTGIGVWGDGVSWGLYGNSPSGTGVVASSSTGYGVSATGGTYGVYSTSSGGTGVYASGDGYGVQALSFSGIGLYATGVSTGVRGTGDWGVLGEGNNYGVLGSATIVGVRGSSPSNIGVQGVGGTYGGDFTGTGGSSYGVYSMGGTYGGRFEGTTGGSIGVFGTSSSGTGVYGNSSSSTGVRAYSGSGYGVYAEGGPNGVVGIAYNSGGSGVYGSNGGNPSTYAGYFVGTLYTSGDLIAGGTKSATVKIDNGEYHLLYAQESPENWFEDFGIARLVDGRATVKIEPLYAQTVNTEITYHVFLTPKGDCLGLFVTNESPISFEIRELQNGKSNLAVSYRIVAKRKGYENIRLPQMQGQTPEEVRAKDESMRSEMASANAKHLDQQALIELKHKNMEAESKLQYEQRAKMDAERKLLEEQKPQIVPKQ